MYFSKFLFAHVYDDDCEKIICSKFTARLAEHVFSLFLGVNSIRRCGGKKRIFDHLV